MKSEAAGVGSGAVLILLMVFVFGVVHPLGAGTRAGAQLKIATKDGTIVQGELLAVKGRALLVDGGNYDRSSAIELDDIRDLAIVGKSKALSGFGIGLLGGAAAGAVGGLVCVPGNVLPDRSPYIAGVMGIGAAAGAILGLIAGSGVHQEKPLIVASVSKLEPIELLKKLRSVAKDPEYR